MSHCCSSGCSSSFNQAKYRTVLWVAMLINLVMFIVEIITSQTSGSISLLADSLDFFGDSANYAISLFVLSKALKIRAKASLLKGGSMAIFGSWVLCSTLYHLFLGEIPNYHQMSVVGGLALVANLISAWILYAYSKGDSNMQGVWICTRNDAIGNILVILAAVAVYFTQSYIPDLLVAFLMAYLAIQGAWQIIQQARRELLIERE
ncbi:cobalt transporter [Mergibacter septicus]|uniref:Cobalt transporter n=1 Tax=Mergibacter septicus TaxID=221402 RepID=A0A8E3MGY1_9PAST|nr:cation diffusion facilitator family transporter [Mergibacter septicus]AWX15863.1 cobalt transporter [Mergibacter septicus]QDJ15116.1 cobalt transporter [Mergibacter septicus]UTU47460.1 cation transporter [Mergibacter septicus]WMR95359.1 cation diffusion facilitator family transporter [Mergibacter septicus]